MEFPHLADTNFPLLENVNVYSYRNEFDYTRWVPSTRVKLTNVLWNSDYRDVVKFESDAKRDEWFNELTDQFTVVLTSNHSIPPEGGIKLPIPYDIAARYNYLVVDIPIMTSADNPIEYESAENGMRRWHFFVDEVSSRAPNTTMFVISLDVWTQFHNDVDIKYMFLERGHAPVAATDVDEYLSYPIENNEYLLTPDVTPSNPSVVKDSDFVPFGDGIKYLCIASTMPPQQFSNLGYVTHNSADYSFIDRLSYHNDPNNQRAGYQFYIDHIGIGSGDDYGTLNRLYASSHTSKPTHGRTPGNVEIYAIRTDYVYGNGSFFQDVIDTVPHFMNSILGCFVVDRSMIEFDDSVGAITLAGHTLHLVYGTGNTINIPKLEKEQFGYPSRYQRFAKLYTYPYASLELTDNDGESVTVRIENTGDIKANRLTNVAFPCLRQRIFFDGINGVGSTTYSWRFLDNNLNSLEMPNSDWFEYCFENDIPCYALYMSGADAWYLDNFNSRIRKTARDCSADYHQGMRLHNTQYANDLDANATANTNVKNNSTALHDNANADANTLDANTTNTVNTRTANTNATIATNVAKTNDANDTSVLINVANADKLNAVNTAADIATVYITGSQNEATAMTTKNNNTAAINGAVGGAAAAGIGFAALSAAGAGAAAGTVAAPGVGTLVGALGGLAVGGTVGLVSTFASAGAADANSSVTISTNQTASDMTVLENDRGTAATISCNSDVTTLQNGNRTFNTNQDNALLAATVGRENANLTNNNANTANTLRGNAARSKNAADTNADNIKNVNDSNTFYMNRDALVENEKEKLEAARRSPQYDYWQAGLEPAKQYGNYAGNTMPDYAATRGVQIKVRTMSDSEVRQVGDWFARFGYALEQVWDIEESGYVPMNHFCYWKCRDIWIDDRKSSNNAAITIMSAMFERGVTIWKNPDEVGRVSVYDN